MLGIQAAVDIDCAVGAASSTCRGSHLVAMSAADSLADWHGSSLACSECQGSAAYAGYFRKAAACWTWKAVMGAASGEGEKRIEGGEATQQWETGMSEGARTSWIARNESCP